jgi:integrase
MKVRVRKAQVRKRGGSPFWYVRYWELRPDGRWKQVWRSSGSLRKADAEALRRRIERQLEGSERPDADMPWEDFKTDFLTKHVDRKCTASRIAYRMCLGAFERTARPKRLGQINVAFLEDFVNSRLAEGVAPSTVNKDLRHLRAALRWAQRREYVDRVPDFSSVFLRVERKQPTTIPEADFVAMLETLKTSPRPLRVRPAPWWRVFLYLAYYLGLRRGEILGLTWDRVRLDTMEIVVSAASSKGRRDRTLPMAPELAEVLNEWRSRQATIPFQGQVLPWPFDTYRKLYDDWQVIQAAAGIAGHRRYVPKDCRSSCASELIASGVPTAVVKDFLGHASVTTTERYYINTQPALRAAVAARKVRLA